MVIIAQQTPVNPCEIKLNLIQSFLNGMAGLLPATPEKFKIGFILSQIDNSVAWGYGSLVRELLQGIAEYAAILIFWKMLKLLLGVFSSQLLK